METTFFFGAQESSCSLQPSTCWSCSALFILPSWFFTAEYCIWHDKWLFGTEQIKQHYQQPVDAFTHGYADPKWSQLNCQFCLINETLTMVARGHLFEERHRLVKHICVSHLFLNCCPKCSCPYCSLSIPTYNLSDHLRNSHNL